MGPRFPLLIALLALGAGPPSQGGSTPVLEEILQVEDRRARGKGDLPLLETALAHGDSAVVQRAARAMGRLEQPALVVRLVPLLQDPRPSVRSEAAQAIAQAAQGFRGDSSLDHRGTTWAMVVHALQDRLQEEADPGVRGMLALSLGRLPFYDPGEIRAARRALLDLCSGVRGESEPNTRFCRGAEFLVRASWRRVPLEEEERRALRDVVRLARGVAPRRHALGALLVSQAADDSTLETAIGDRDAELRRLALTGVRRGEESWERHPVLSRGLADSVPAVQQEALRALARYAGSGGCARLNRGTQHPAPMVSLVAIDLLNQCGGNETAMLRLQSLAGQGRFPRGYAPARTSTWHPAAHALVSLARAMPAAAAPLIPEIAVHPIWQLRMYAARAAAALGDSATLAILGTDEVPNVREAALTGLVQVQGHRADAIYRGALTAADFQLLRTAARALAGTPEKRAAVPGLLLAFGKVTDAVAWTSRDTRVELLNRLREVGDRSDAPLLLGRLNDIDPVVAESVASVLGAWTGAPPPRPEAREPESARPVTLAEVDSLRGTRLVLRLDNGHAVEIALLVDQAPLTTARIARLVRRHYYDNTTFHRIAPNFVIQGGGPGANEYSGSAEFLRDELTDLSHARGTVGTSTRGRDTGDAQLFVNLRDNPRLDYEYTVWGRVVSGLSAIDGMLEGTRIRGAEIRPPR